MEALDGVLRVYAHWFVTLSSLTRVFPMELYARPGEGLLLVWMSPFVRIAVPRMCAIQPEQHRVGASRMALKQWARLRALARHLPAVGMLSPLPGA